MKFKKRKPVRDLQFELHDRPRFTLDRSPLKLEFDFAAPDAREVLAEFGPGNEDLQDKCVCFSTSWEQAAKILLRTPSGDGQFHFHPVDLDWLADAWRFTDKVETIVNGPLSPDELDAMGLPSEPQPAD